MLGSRLPKCFSYLKEVRQTRRQDAKTTLARLAVKIVPPPPKCGHCVSHHLLIINVLNPSAANCVVCFLLLAISCSSSLVVGAFKRSKITLSAPLQYNTNVLLGRRTMTLIKAEHER